MAALAVLFSINGVASAAQDGIFEIEAEGSYRMEAGASIDLAKKYPNWGDVYMAKALVYYVIHEPVFMKKALNEACRLGHQTACDDLTNIKRVHEHDFGLTIID